MKLVQLFFTGVLVMGMQMHAQEQSFSIPEAPEADGKYAQYALLAAQEAAEKQTVVTMEEPSESGAPAASQQSYSHTLSPLLTQTETESAGDKESTASESSEETGVELASSSESFEKLVLSPKPTQAAQHLKPPRTLKTADVFTAFFDDMAQNKIPALKANYSSSTRAEYVKQLQDKKRSLEKYQRGEELETLKGRANQLIGRLNRMDQALHKRLPSISAPPEDSFSPDGSQENDEEVTQASASTPSKNHVTPRSKPIFAWIFGGTVAAAAVVTIVYYLWYNKLPVLQHK